MPIQGSNSKSVSTTNTKTNDMNNSIRVKEISTTISNGANLLKNAIIENYDLDEELSKEGIINKDNIDFSRIATSTSNVKSKNFITVKNTKYWGDTGNLTYKIRDDGTVSIMENGVVLGFTDLEGIRIKEANIVDGNKISSSSNEDAHNSLSDEFYNERYYKEDNTIIKQEEIEVLEEKPTTRGKAAVEIENTNKVRESLLASGAEEVDGMLIPKRQFGYVPQEEDLSDTDIIENPQIDIHLEENDIEVYIPQEQLDNVGIVKYAPITVEEKEAYQKAQKLKEDITSICEANGIEIEIMYDWRPRDSGYGTYHATSHHPEGKAIDIIPKDGDFTKLKEFLVTNEDMRNCIDKYGYGVLDESQEGLLRNTGGERFHFHIGPDKKGRATWEEWKQEYNIN